MRFLSALALVVTSVTIVAVKNPHKVTSLPNYADSKPINFDHYAGYIPLPSNGQKMFYWLVESESKDSTKDPLILWLNGGPGCSSLGGMFTELGPFIVQTDLSVVRNPYAWNRRANILFLESPAGVGFSQPVLNTSEYNDDTTADRAYEFLVQFLAKYPTYKHRDFYVMGESYAGMYVPFILYQLVTKPIANLKLTGFAVGNPYTDQKIDDASTIDYYFSHAMVSVDDYRVIQAACQPSEIWMCQDNYVGCSDACKAVYKQVNGSIGLDLMNPYYIYGDICFLQPNQTGPLATRHRRTPPAPTSTPFDACIDIPTGVYLGLAKVQRAIHAIGDHEPPIEWVDCSDYIGAVFTMALTVLDKYPTLLNAGLKALVYSGDADAVVNFMGTQRWLTKDGLDLPVTSAWKAWLTPDKQVAGYSQTYGNVTFKTVKGASHLVPQTHPLHALYLFECFVFGHDACAKFSYPKDPAEAATGALYFKAQHTDSTLTTWISGTAALVVIAIALVALQKPKGKKSHYVLLRSAAPLAIARV
ncbi:Aste57867_11138 [Aphanomyces stellatus]|uniref:Carboxypeptidase n=1 Tax=Aphanomyces stellatus TaxID=120398 RepID=A0A485KS31_9STRA|nr:hypothetical protein As57867_011096 [Aphanomyces stellatus]VFT88005.1 Aste57867_11138 [Aphanomyces stellatus]